MVVETGVRNNRLGPIARHQTESAHSSSYSVPHQNRNSFTSWGIRYLQRREHKCVTFVYKMPSVATLYLLSYEVSI